MVTPTVEQAGNLKGIFRGFHNRHARFSFSNGVVWRQNEQKYVYFYAYGPRARVMYKQGVYWLEVAGTDEVVEVVREL